MDLETLYMQVKEALAGLDFDSIWPGFAPLKYALYDSESCFFDGRFVEKTEAFCANTSIVYEGSQIAIWMVQEELAVPVLTSKIVHEMFHGFQNQKGWDCWPDEMEALRRYGYDAENLSLRLRENELLLALLKGFDRDAFSELLSLRKLRSVRFPYEFSYESRVEEIEGTANYVEWQVLRQLDESRAAALEDHMRAVITRPEYLFPVRISCYYTGTLMIHALRSAGAYSFAPAERPVMLSALEDVEAAETDAGAGSRKVAEAIEAFNAETDGIIRSALERNEVVLNGPAELTGVNVYNARCRGGFITSTYFLMYRGGEENRMLTGNFVIGMKDEKTIDRVYRWQ